MTINRKHVFPRLGEHYSYIRLPMGLKVGPPALQRYINNVLLAQRDEMCFLYLDDVICFTFLKNLGNQI